LLSAVTRVELSFVIEGRKGETGRTDLELLLRDGAFTIVSVPPLRPRAPLGVLNIGDCFSYARRP
jgi:ribonuclease VapC